MINTILITGIGGPTPRSIAKTLKIRFPGSRIIGVDANPKALGFFMPELLDKYFLVPRMSSPDYWPFIENLISIEDIDIAFVQPELEVIGWNQRLREVGKLPVPVLIPPLEMAVSLMDKSIMAEILEGTEFIPRTIKVTQSDPKFDLIEKEIGFPCWIRATKGSGGLGSLKLTNLANYKSWLFINNDIPEFTVSEFLTGRHLATQQLYLDGEYIKGASLDCSEYVMASIAPSKVTGNTSFGRFLNEDHILEFCDRCIHYVSEKLNVVPHGVFSFDLKEDNMGNLKVTEINIRHMAYTGVMAQVGFDLVSDTVEYLIHGSSKISRAPFFHYSKPYVFLRDVDVEPIILDSENLFPSLA